MTNKPDLEFDCNNPKNFQIRVKGHLDDQWSDWFDDLVISQEEDNTTLITGLIIDNAALHGLLKKVRDSGLCLISVNQIEAGQENNFDQNSTIQIQGEENGK